MEQVLFRTHSKLVNLSVRCLHPFMRKTIEYTTLLLACYTAVILFVLHSTYISTSNVANYNCLITNDYVFQTVNRSNSYTDSYSCNSSHEYCINSNFYNCSRNWMDYVYLQPSETNSNIQNHNSYSYRNSYSSNSKCSDSNCRRGSNSALIDLYSHYDLIKLEIVQRRKFSIQNMWNTYVSQRVDSPTKCDYNDSNSSCNSNSNSYYENSIAGIDSNIDKHIYYYSSDRGLLLLRDELKAKHNFTMLTVVVDTSHICFGPSSYVWLIENMVGFDTVIVNWGLTAFQGIGYVFNTNSKQIFNLNYAEELFLSKGNSFFDKGKSINYDILNGETESMYSKSMSLLLPIHNTFLYLEKHVQELIHSINSKEIIIIHPSIHALVDKFVLFLNDYCIDNKVYQTVTNTLSSVYDSSRTSKDNLDRVDNYSGNSNDTEGLYLKLLRNNYRIMIKLVKQMKPFVSFRANVFVTTTFVFFVSTSLISFTLRETQERMLRFTYMLQHRITHRMPYLALVFKHVIESLVFVPIIVGITFFLFEFYSDQLVRPYLTVSYY